jgi:hypothetical protein
VTALVLQQAGGRVRCGGCGHAFSALDHLSESMPEPAEDHLEESPGDDFTIDTADDELPGDDELAETSRRLLETLDELAGPGDVRIEDTGVEWRVLDEVVDSQDGSLSDEDSTAQEPLERSPEEEPGAFERRYDDNTPLDDDFDDDRGEYTPPAITPKRRAGDNQQPDSAEVDEVQEDLALSEPADWTGLLDDDSGAEAIQHEDEENLAAIHDQPSSAAAEPVPEPSPVELNQPVDLDQQFEMQAEAMGLEITGRHDIGAEALTDEIPLLDDDYVDPASTGSISEASVEDEPDSEHSDQIELPGGDLAEDDFEEYSGEVESIADDLAEDEVEEISAEVEQIHDDLADDEPEEEDPTALELTDQEENDDENDEGIQGSPAESTGEFEASIDVAARALDDGEIEEWSDADADSPAESDEDYAVLEGADEAEDDTETDETSADDIELTADSADDEEQEISAEDEALIREIEAHEEPTPDDERVTTPASDDEQTIMEAFGADVASKMFDENSAEVETIIMEGEFVRSAIDKERLAAENDARSQIDEYGKLADTYALNREGLRGGRRRYDPTSFTVIVGVVVLGLLLVGQVMHGTRDSLATIGFFNQTMGPVYRMLGNPITPQWDIKGWQFESTSGSTDEDEKVLTVFSRLVNKSEQPLPFPLVHVSLTDRWEEIIGSRVLEPNDYLAGDLDPSKPVTPGENFTAVITIDSPSDEATGFKLNVCYRVSPGRVRCAIEDFKN